MRIKPFGFLLLILPGLLAAKSYSYPEIRTHFSLQTDGSVHVSQLRTYEFDGSYSWAFVDLKKQGCDDIVLNGLAELGPDGWHDLVPSELDNTAKSLYIRWDYSAQDEERTFRLDYTLVGAVKRYTDVAEFYWKAIEDEHEPVASAVIELELPQASAGLFKVYVHSAAAPGKLEFNPDFSGATITQSGIPRNAFVEVRALVEPAMFTHVASIEKPALERILSEEKRNFVASEMRKYFFIPLGLLLVLPLPIILLIFFYVRYGREPRIEYEALYEHEPPRKAPPVVVPIIQYQKPSESGLTQPLFQSMMASLLDLARRGAVVVQEEKHGHKTKYRFRLTKPEVAEKGDEFDRSVIDFFFGRVAAGTGEFDEDALKSYGKNETMAARAYIRQLLEAGIGWWRSALGVDFVEKASSRAYGWFMLIVVVSCGLGMLALEHGLSDFLRFGRNGFIVTVIATVAASFIYALLGSSILRWTPAAYLEHRRWQNFRKFLKDFSAIEQAPLNLFAIWEQYYVYAVALGVADEFLKHISRLAEARGTGLVLPIWYMAAVGSGPGGVANLSQSLGGFSSFASNMSGMMQSFSSASSSGGGFSGGGGGGGGGGSSGAG